MPDAEFLFGQVYVIFDHYTDIIYLMGLNYKEHEIELEQLRIRKGSDYCGERLAETGILSDRRLIVLSIKKKDGQLMFNPDPETVLETDDTVIAIGDREVLSRMGAF